ncbi:Golgi-specific brefeldin A-resistance guanine nucleotide exchange factor 1 [Halotydeus destructor]|nr:Golgi-specific brefeldin A-resistance guanine nucleotide exchange factor 1 [Halotydeus destructor]
MEQSVPMEKPSTLRHHGSDAKLSAMITEDEAKIVVLGEASMLTTAVLKIHHANHNYYFGSRSTGMGLKTSASVPNRLAAVAATENEEDEDDYLDTTFGVGNEHQASSNSPIDSILKSLIRLKGKLRKGSRAGYSVISDPNYLKPFCEIIKNKDTRHTEQFGSVVAIGDSVTKARFVGTDTSSDEVVLFRILCVLKELIVREYKTLTNELVCEIMQSCFRIAFEPRLSELLRKNAEQALGDMCRSLFSRIAEFPNEITSVSTVKMSGTTKPANKKAQKQQSEKLDGNVVSHSSSDPALVNSQGIKFSESEPLSSVEPKKKPIPPEPHSLACVHELLAYLTSLVNPLADGQNSEAMITVGLNLLIIAFENCTSSIDKKACLMSTVKNEICWNIIMLLQNDRPLTTFALTIRLAFVIFTSLRRHLKYQMESLFVRMMDIITTGNAPLEFRELSLEYLVGFFRHIVYLPHELFYNYDCDPSASNLLEDLLQLFSKNCFASTANVPNASGTVQGQFFVFSPIQLLSLDALLASLKSLQKAELCKEDSLIYVYPENSVITSEKERNDSILSCHFDVGKANSNEEPVEVIRDTNHTYITIEVEEEPSKPVVENKRVPILCPKGVEDILQLKSKKRLLWQAAEQFNAKPTKGIAYLHEHGLVHNDHEIARFLIETARLDKKQIGEYLSNRKNLAILRAFAAAFPFKGLRIDQALRMYLESFRLPGESPLISLIMEQFAHYWHEANGCPFANEDGAFSLAYAIIMLNVDQHNSNVKRQTTPMTYDEFKSNLRQVNGGKDFDPELLKEIYHCIKHDEIVMPAEQHGVVRERYLWKCLLRKSETASGIYLCARSHASEKEEEPNATDVVKVQLYLFHSHIFSVLWGPTVAAMTFVFDKININHNSSLTRRILNNGFNSCALLCATYGHLDDLIVSLCKFTVSAAGSPTSPLLSSKSQLAAQCLFGITREYANEMRESWTNVIEIILSWFKAGFLNDALEVDDFALGLEKHKVCRRSNSKKMPKTATEGSFLTSFYSYFAGNQEQQGEVTEVEKNAIEKSSQNNAQANESSLINGVCQPLVMIEDSKFLHIDSLVELIKALINVNLEMGDESGDDIEAFKLEVLLQIILLNRDRVSIFWPQVSNYLLRVMRLSTVSGYLTERVISAIFRLAIRFAPRPDYTLNDQIFMLLRHMLVTFEVKTMQQQFTAVALQSFISHCHTYITQVEDWSLIFELLLCVGIGYQARRPSLRKNTLDGSIESINVQSENEDAYRLEHVDPASVRGYTSDSEVDLQRGVTSTEPVTNPYQLMTGNSIGTGRNSSFKVYDITAYEKCAEILTLIIREILPKNVEQVKSQDGVDENLSAITNMAIDSLRKYVEASVKIQSNDSHVKRSGSQGRHVYDHRKPAPHTRSRVVPVSSSESESEADHGAQAVDTAKAPKPQPKLSSVTESTALKLLDLMHYLHLNATVATQNSAQEYVWTTLWCPLLQGIALLCCDARRPVRTCALTFLQRALLLHDLGMLTAHQWESCFNKVLFPLLAKLLEPLNLCDPIGMDETRMRATNLLCKVFLQHLSPLLTLPTFTALWLTILDFMDKYVKSDTHTDLVKEAIPESLKNMLLVMDTAGCLDDHLRSITWDRISSFLPSLKQELALASASNGPPPVVNSGGPLPTPSEPTTAL